MTCKAVAAHAYVYPRWQCNFKPLVSLSHTQILCVACLVMAMHSHRKIIGTLKTLNILAIFLSVNFVSAKCSWVAINFFPRNGNAIISESCIAMED